MCPHGLPHCDGPPTRAPTEWSGPTFRRSQTGPHPPTDVEPPPCAAPLLTFGPPRSMNRSEKPNRNDVLPVRDLQKRNDVLLFTAERCPAGRHLRSVPTRTGNHILRVTLPRLDRSASIRWASPARSSGSVSLMTGRTFPWPIRPRSSASSPALGLATPMISVS